MSHSAAASSPRYPRLLRRVRAGLIDSVILSVVVLTWWLLLGLLDSFPPSVRLAYPVLAFVLLEPVMVSFTGGSPGHHLMGVTIRDAGTGRRIGMIRAAARFLLRGFFGWLSLLFVLTTARHQALHDLFCRTNVVLLDPGSLPDREKLSERVTEDPEFSYPSKTRRIVVIVTYVLLTFVLASVVSALTLSEACLWRNQCNPVDVIASLVLNGAMIAGAGASIVLGWRARLYGCRRRRL